MRKLARWEYLQGNREKDGEKKREREREREKERRGKKNLETSYASRFKAGEFYKIIVP